MEVSIKKGFPFPSWCKAHVMSAVHCPSTTKSGFPQHPTKFFRDLYPQNLPPVNVVRKSPTTIMFVIPPEAGKFVWRSSERLVFGYHLFTGELLIGPTEAFGYKGQKAKRRKNGIVSFSKTYSQSLVSTLFPANDHDEISLTNVRIVLIENKKCLAMTHPAHECVSNYIKGRVIISQDEKNRKYSADEMQNDPNLVGFDIDPFDVHYFQ